MLQAPPGNRSDLDLSFSIDLGVDVAFSPRLTVRFAGTVGDREALSVGAVF